MADDKPFVPALLVVDVQNDFISGSLAVPNAQDILPHINTLLTHPFPVKLRTLDWHPPSHISFSANHPNTSPFTSKTTVTHPSDPSRSYKTTLWPVHCVQNSWGAEPPEGLHVAKADGVVKKGMDERVEMYSAFRDPFGIEDSGLKGKLEMEGITDVFVVGLAGDICVKETARGAVEEGFRTWFVEEGTKPVDGEKWETCKKEMEGVGIKVVSIHGEEVQRVANLPR